MHNTPIIVFINKLDRPGRDPFDLLDEIEKELKIGVRPLAWPMGSGTDFKGVYNIYEQSLYLFTPESKNLKTVLSSGISMIQNLFNILVTGQPLLCMGT